MGRSGANTPGRVSRPIEHPGRNLQPSRRCPTREAATENLSASLLNHLMNMDQASGPRMPRIKKLVLRDPVGVPSSCFITRLARTFQSARTRRRREQYIPLVAFCRRHSLADFIICMCEFDSDRHRTHAMHAQEAVRIYRLGVMIPSPKSHHTSQRLTRSPVDIEHRRCAVGTRVSQRQIWRET